MPLIQSGSKEALQKNIATEISAGKEPKQAEAIAYSVQRQNDAPEYVALAVPCFPETVTASEINSRNRTYWEKQG